MPGIAFLHRSPKDLRRTFRQRGAVDWSVALPLVLEKHGYAGLEPRTFRSLGDRDALQEFDGFILAHQPPEDWDSDLARALIESARPLLIEGPAPPPFREALGITTAQPTDPLGSLLATAPELSRAAAAFGHAGLGRLSEPTSRHVERDPSMDWRAVGAPIAEDQAEAWNRRGWEAESWTVSERTAVLAEWAPASQPADRTPAIVRRGQVTAMSIGLFAALAQGHTAEPWGSAEFRTTPRSLGLEFVVLALIDQMYAVAGLVRPRVLPWPRGGRWAMSVRHDFDRALTPGRVADALSRHDEARTAATWYWRSRHLHWGRRRLRQRVRPAESREALRLVAGHPRMEVAHHTERLWAGGDKEQRTLERVMSRPVLGTSAHGDPTCFRFQGAPNILWAEHQRLLYTEVLERAHSTPHRFAALKPDGIVAPLKVICLPHHESLDVSTLPPTADEARITSAAKSFSAVGGFLQVMNHPDINLDALFRAIGEIPANGRLDWTAARAADWWRRSHVRDNLRVESLDGGAVRITSSLGVRDLALELLSPSGERRSSIVTLDKGESTVVTVRPAEVSI